MECGSSLSLKFVLLLSLLLLGQAKKLAVCFKKGSSQINTRQLAAKNNYIIEKSVGDNCFVFRKKAPRSKREAVETNHETVETNILYDPFVEEAEVSVPKQRVKRRGIRNETKSRKRSRHSALDTFVSTFADPIFNRQWHLRNEEFSGRDLNVLPVWSGNITGQGVTVAILDDGVEHTHPDIHDNYDGSVSWDFLDNDDDPTPKTSVSDRDVDHGTRCAGQVAAVKNDYCGVGVAYGAKIAGIRMLKDKVEDSMEAEALKFSRDRIDIYSSSWGPIDDGKKMDGPGLLVRKALEDGVKYGRLGKGSVYVWASGNGGQSKDNCNCDGYCSSIFTISISAVNDKGQVPAYVEECSATLAAAYSSGGGTERKIATTDLNSKCTEEHGGTSAAAPLAAGVIALALSANSALSWRDVQHIIVGSSYHPYPEDTTINGAGRRINNKIGFGILDSLRMVELAKTWNRVPEQHICSIVRPPEYLSSIKDAKIKDSKTMRIQIETNACRGMSQEVASLEHVQVVLSIEHEFRGSLKISLTSPMGTTSPLLTERPSDKNSQGFARWTFLTVQMWSERAAGHWELIIESTGNGELTDLELILYGTKFNNNPIGPICDTYTLHDDKTSEVSCVDECPVFGYYTSSRVCRPCRSSCSTCNEYNYCTSCTDPLLLNPRDNTCVTECPPGYTAQDSKLTGEVCTKALTPAPWYKGDTIYVIIVVVFITMIIGVVLAISTLHYRRYKNAGSTQYHQQSPIEHTRLKPIVALPAPTSDHDHQIRIVMTSRDQVMTSRDQVMTSRDQVILMTSRDIRTGLYDPG